MQDFILKLRAKIDAQLESLIRGVEKFCLLDFPNHDNIGDSAIYMGETSFFRKKQLVPSFVSTCEINDWRSLGRTIEDGTIFLHGGGNFGDIWPVYQAFREEVLGRFREQAIVQLPQTIHYESPQSIDRTARLIEKHPRFTLLVRDLPSLELAQRKFQCQVWLCPDMAFQLDLAGSKAPQEELLLLLRTDKELADRNSRSGSIGALRTADWPHEDRGKFERTAKFSAIVTSLRELKLDKAGLRRHYYETLASRRVARGVDLLSSSRLVITDRLHGHIICLLLGIPHCVIDNSYGKLSSYMKAWGTDVKGVYMARSVSEAITILVEREGLDLDKARAASMQVGPDRPCAA